MQRHPSAADLQALLAKLSDAGVEFIIVGGAAAVMQGAPITTNDLDIVHRRTPENVARLLEVLQQIDATMRYDFAHRGLRPTAGEDRSTFPHCLGRSTHCANSMSGKATTSYWRIASRS